MILNIETSLYHPITVSGVKEKNRRNRGNLVHSTMSVR